MSYKIGKESHPVCHQDLGTCQKSLEDFELMAVVDQREAEEEDLSQTVTGLQEA